MLWHGDKLSTSVHHHETSVATSHGLAFLRLPVVWWCFTLFVFSTVALSVVQSFSVSILQAVHGVSFEAAFYTLTAYMVCGAEGMLFGGFGAAHSARSDQVVAYAMAGGAVLLALCGTGWLGPTRTMFVLAATGRVYGLVYSGLDTGLALAPLAFGLFMDRGWYGATLVGAAAVLSLSVAVALGVGQMARPT